MQRFRCLLTLGHIYFSPEAHTKRWHVGYWHHLQYASSQLLSLLFTARRRFPIEHFSIFLVHLDHFKATIHSRISRRAPSHYTLFGSCVLVVIGRRFNCLRNVPRLLLIGSEEMALASCWCWEYAVVAYRQRCFFRDTQVQTTQLTSTSHGRQTYGHSSRKTPSTYRSCCML